MVNQDKTWQTRIKHDSIYVGFDGYAVRIEWFEDEQTSWVIMGVYPAKLCFSLRGGSHKQYGLGFEFKLKHSK